MTDRKRFQNQTLNSEDYEKTEEVAKKVKKGGGVATLLTLVAVVGKKYGPVIIKKLKKIRKL